jgi:hypothetical protein
VAENDEGAPSCRAWYAHRHQLAKRFSFGRSVWYISMDASIPLAAAIEHNTYAPLMDSLHLGGDDTFSSPIECIFIATNGPEEGSCDNPLRQVSRQIWPMDPGRTTPVPITRLR